MPPSCCLLLLSFSYFLLFSYFLKLPSGGANFTSFHLTCKFSFLLWTPPLCAGFAVDLVLDQLQRERHVAELRDRQERDKQAAESKRQQQQQQQADRQQGDDETMDDLTASSVAIKPIIDKHGKPIPRPLRPM